MIPETRHQWCLSYLLVKGPKGRVPLKRKRAIGSDHSRRATDIIRGRLTDMIEVYGRGPGAALEKAGEETPPD